MAVMFTPESLAAFMAQSSMPLPSAAGDAAANPAGFDRVAYLPMLENQVASFFAEALSPRDGSCLGKDFFRGDRGDFACVVVGLVPMRIDSPRKQHRAWLRTIFCVRCRIPAR